MIEQQQQRINGFDVNLVTISNDDCKAVFTDLGARLVELHVPDRDGNTADVVLQRPTLDDMATDDNYMGSTAGRYANRIRDGRLTIEGNPVQLTRNEGENHLHGGHQGFDRRIWSMQLGTDGVTFWRVSPDGEEGYPGTLTTAVKYRLEGRSLHLDITAGTDAPTVANIVHHSYFNLAGHDSGTVLDHLLEMRSSYYTPVDDALLPTGEILTVSGTPFDFRNPTPIGQNIRDVSNSGAGRVTEEGVGYDHNWVLEGIGMREVVFLEDPASGRRLTMSTNQPGVQLYVGGYLEGVTAKGSAGGTYPAFAGLTLETQTFPDAVNQSHFPQAALVPGEAYHNMIRFDFSTDAGPDVA